MVSVYLNPLFDFYSAHEEHESAAHAQKPSRCLSPAFEFYLKPAQKPTCAFCIWFFHTRRNCGPVETAPAGRTIGEVKYEDMHTNIQTKPQIEFVYTCN